MATASSLKNQLAKKEGAGQAPAISNSVKGLMDSPAVKKRFEEVLMERAPQYMSSIVNLVNSDTNLKKCEPMSVIASCMVAATMDLPVDKNLGYAWVVPYGTKAQFQMGYKGYIQLALRTGQYKAINVVEIREGELINWNPLSEEVEIDFTQRKSDKVIGYAGYFKLLNGFEKTVYWSKEEVESHAKKFSKTYSFKNGVWQTDFDSMAKKTVLRNLLSKWGILSIEMQKAYSADNNTIKDSILKEDNVEIDFETGEVIEDVEYADPVQENFVGTSFEEMTE
ncbi:MULTISPECIES: recombinase RecT [Clostridium]|uniref:recombinase RecT n=1 Tax=Clostridium TaxID=1485 RepID=UPI0018A91037|nr:MULTISPECIES: recombinase RecT [Clostridium]MDB1969441.1 recombinase RecT [Clostridium tertium]MDU2683802.1 recombinase RecT [Clostridium sp.]